MRNHLLTMAIILGTICATAVGKAQDAAADRPGATAPQSPAALRLPVAIPVEILGNPVTTAIRERNETEARQREIDTLAVQQQMNIAAQQSTFYTQMQTWLVGIGQALLLVTLFYMHRANQAAFAAVNTSREIGHAQTRPYLGIEKILIEETPDTAPRLRLHIRNHGQSTAVTVDCRATYYWVEGENSEFSLPSRQIEVAQRRAPFSLFGGQMRGTSFNLDKRGDMTMFVSSSLTYHDIQGNRYRTREVFRYLTRDGGKSFAFETYGKYSRAN